MVRLSFLHMFIAVFLLCAFGCGCNLDGMRSDDGSVMVMTYNVQNLFDQFVSGNEYPEFTPEGGWSADAYRIRLERTAQAISQGHGRIPDVVLLQEVEHERVLQELVETHLAKWGFRWYAATDERDSPVQLGMVSRYPIVESVSHRVHGSRPILEGTVDLGNEYLTILNVHAKSRKGGIEETEQQRMDTSRAIAARAKEVLAANPFRAVMVAGDFNESADAAIREEGFDHALVPLDSPDCARQSYGGSLPVTGAVPPQGAWYTWWLDRSMTLMAKSPGSYLYQGVWETYDQLLLSPAFFDGYGIEFLNGMVGAHAPLTDDGGHPAAYDGRTGKGYSDHLPVSVILSGR
ncbi:MAG: endonuclease/exonuclease/phosphatase family protein [Sphaerochaetaceae bacterium]|nr:endonuclease/exonuclease/phosphatase family protein [Sphaerochaetaceae bacterium]MDD3941215.1 endonuclease/exonuclease/phosphatase family protein [Sphaerochaetaceae bacterium]